MPASRGGEYRDPEIVRQAGLSRQEALEHEGWIVIRVRWEDLEDSADPVLPRRVRCYLGAAGASGEFRRRPEQRRGRGSRCPGTPALVHRRNGYLASVALPTLV